ncbi:LPP20 family lipoprotein [Crenobacter cavernae]|uniref:Lipoprotein LPP20-like domain-containing protein n=1 Tax=Crenobacter cavernae TaxID=2290923 RepID=A0A345Y764_9NEIS|nr:LPP20 family lipoprotein [Crenobacter cavernae]AXK39766.1 hypothetical protein DWG20_10125 [Crenobacter cavernae]
MKAALSLSFALSLTALAMTACAQTNAPKAALVPAEPVSSSYPAQTGAGYVGQGAEAAPAAEEKVVVKEVVKEVNPYRPIVIRVTGVGAAPGGRGLSTSQRKLLSMRAARLDAYRSVAEQVQGVRLVGGSSVSNLVVQSDAFRVYVDSYLRGVRVLSTSLKPDGSSETVAEITLEQDFYQAYKQALLNSGSVKKAADMVPVAGSACRDGRCGEASPSLGNNYYLAQ